MSARAGALLAALAVVAACATTRPSAELAEARTLYQGLMASGADRQVEADLLRTNTAITDAEAAYTARKAQEDVDALGHIALRLAQTAEANHARLAAERAADSLRTARLRRLLTLSEAQRTDLETKRQLSEREWKRCVNERIRSALQPRRRTADSTRQWDSSARSSPRSRICSRRSVAS